MVFVKRYMLLALLFKVNCLFSQDITGTWEGDMNQFEFLQLNIVQVGDNLCGYTWDYLYANKKSFCKAYCSGSYNKNKMELIITGTSFIANSGDHELMRLKLKDKLVAGEKVLEGNLMPMSFMGSIFALVNPQPVYLRKVSDKPSRIMPNMKDCMKAKKEKKDIVKIKPVDSSKKITVPVKPVEIDHPDSLQKINSPVVPVITVKDTSQIAKQMTARKNTEMKRLVVTEKNITLNVYDNGVVDGDTVSIFYNGKLILSHQRLSEKPIIIPIVLDEKISLHEITLFAENLGSIPPNTALIVVHAGDKRYELYASSSLTENAVISFEYKPK